MKHAIIGAAILVARVVHADDAPTKPADEDPEPAAMAAEMPAGPDHAQPVAQALAGVDEVLQAVAAMDEIEFPIRHTLEELRVAVLPIPGLDRRHLAEQFPVQGQRIGFAADIQSPPDKIAINEVRI